MYGNSCYILFELVRGLCILLWIVEWWAIFSHIWISRVTAAEGLRTRWRSE